MLNNIFITPGHLYQVEQSHGERTRLFHAIRAVHMDIRCPQIRVDNLSTKIVDKRIYSSCRQRYADDEPLPSRRTTCRFYFERSLIVFARLLALAV